MWQQQRIVWLTIICIVTRWHLFSRVREASALVRFTLSLQAYRGGSSSSRSRTTPLTYSSPVEDVSSIPPIPITVISGFLGSGKTTLLQNMLQNNQGLRIAVVVNDVASVNIDSKLVASQNLAAGMVELQNGCACCSLSEELLSSVSSLVTLSDMRRMARSAGDEGNNNNNDDDDGSLDNAATGAFDHIVVEMSGVADPKSVRAKFQEAVLYDMPLMERVRLDTMVTVVDCSTFWEHLQSTKLANTNEAPELFYRSGDRTIEDDNVGEENWVNIPSSLQELLVARGVSKENFQASPATGDEGAVADLLISQAETADVVLLNKVDLASESRVAELREIITAINPRATIRRSEYGQVPLREILAVAQGTGVVQAGIVDDHRDAVQAATTASTAGPCTDPICTDPTHSHDHVHEHRQDGLDNTDPTRSDLTHNHNHSTRMNHPSHSHAHDHACTDPICTDPSHSLDGRRLKASHNADTCTDPACTDPSHAISSSSVTTHAGIGTYVYRARRPFHPTRLTAFMHYLPVVRGLPPKDQQELQIDTKKVSVTPIAQAALRKVLRSKGFVWCAHSHVAALYWSHAGSSMELGCLGSWWATLPRTQWPAEAVTSILQDFDDPQHEEQTTGEMTSVGDRRQELVLIGPTLSDQSKQKEIQDALDQCLLNDQEWSVYVSRRANNKDLCEAFPNPIAINMLTF